MINPREWTKYANTYYVEVKEEDGSITTHEKISANSPMEVARLFKKDAKRCKKKDSIIYVISNGWRFGEKAKNCYYS